MASSLNLIINSLLQMPDSKTQVVFSIKRLHLIPSLVFIVALAIALLIVHIYKELWNKDQTLLITEIANGQSSIIERRLSRSISATYILESMLRRHNGKLDDFDSIAKNIIASIGGISNLQLSPNGIVQRIYPSTSNKQGLGHNILRDDNSKTDALLAISNKQLTLVGPFKLSQGGVAIIARNPVFLHGDNNEEKFWGFTSVLIYLDELLEDTKLNELQEKGYHFQLSHIQADSGEHEFFAGNTAAFPVKHAITQPIKLPNGEWLLHLSRSYPKYNFITDITLYCLAFIFSSLLSYFVYALLKQPDKLNRIVQKRTQELKRLAFYDPLTQLPNRTMLRDRLKQEIIKSKRSLLPLALLFIDLDQFKEVNDTLGHDMGDLLLIQAAQRINACVRKSDTVARLGGDEFTVILCEQQETLSIERITQNIIKTLSQPFYLKDELAYVSASVGITLYPNDSNNIDSLLKNADQAMYLAKSTGRSRFSYFTQSMQVKAQLRLQLINDLRGAISKNQLQLYYQPIVNLTTGKIHKAEALLRWNHPERGMINPAEFIHLAEESRLIIEIGDWVFKESAYQVKRCKSLYDNNFEISINKSPVQFHATTHHLDWLNFLQTQKIPGNNIVIEITESLLMDSSSNIAKQLIELREAGMQLALDDFGTGYSALSYLNKFDIDFLKIDQCFTRNLTPTSSDMALSEAIIMMAHKLGLKVIAEGVETESQWQLLCSAGCDFGQGYLFSRPLPADAFENLLKQNKHSQREKYVSKEY